MAFMVGSFAGGLSEGLTEGFRLGSAIQESIARNEMRKAVRAATGTTGGTDTTLPAVKDLGAKPPSPTDTTGAGGGETYDPNDPAAKTPAPPPGQKADPLAGTGFKTGLGIAKVPNIAQALPRAGAAAAPAAGQEVARAALPPPIPLDAATDASAGIPSVSPPAASPTIVPPQSLTAARDRVMSGIGSMIGSYLSPAPLAPPAQAIPSRSFTAPIVEGGPVTYDEVTTDMPSPGSVPYQPTRAQPNPRGIWGTMEDIGGGVQTAGQAIGTNLYARLPPRQIAVPPARYPPGSLYGSTERIGQVPAHLYNWIFGLR